MLIMKNGLVYLTGRKTEANGEKKLQFFQIKMILPDSLFDEEEHSIKAVFDGELCIEKYAKYDKPEK